MKMLRAVPLLGGLSVMVPGLAQEGLPGVEWVRTFGESRTHERGRSVVQSNDGDFVIAGAGGSTGNFETGRALLLRLDAHGARDESRWPSNPRLFPMLIDARAIRGTSDGGFVVAGFARHASRWDGYVLKLDKNAEIDPGWAVNPRTFGGDRDDGARAVWPTEDGGVVVAGSTSVAARDTRGYVSKLDARGELDDAWTENPRILGSRGLDTFHGVIQTSDGGYLVVGRTSDQEGLSVDAWFLRLNVRGELDEGWSENPRTIAGHELAHDVEEAPDGGYLILTRSGLLKIDRSGEPDDSWSENPRILDGNLSGMDVTNDGGIVVCGSLLEDVLVIKLDEFGDVDRSWPENPMTFGGPEHDFSHDIRQTTDGGYVVVGKTKSQWGDLYAVKLAPVTVPFRRGDVTADGAVNLSDAVFALNYLFLAASAPSCEDTADSDDNGTVNLSDVVFLLNAIFLGGAPLSPPSLDCAPDPTHDDPLDCLTFDACPI